MSKIFDNLDDTRRFEIGLNNLISHSNHKRVDFCTGYFNLRGWDLIMNGIDNLSGDYVDEDDPNNPRPFRVCRLLIGMNQSPEELIQLQYGRKRKRIDSDTINKYRRQIVSMFRKQILIGLPTERDKITLLKLKQQLDNGKVCVKLHMQYPLHAKLYIAHPADNDTISKGYALMGSSNLTFAGLTRNGELNADHSDEHEVEVFSKWFDERWNNQYSIDITKDLMEVLDQSWAGMQSIPPYFIYLKTAYHLSKDARDGESEFRIPFEFKDELFPFQKIAVQIAARHLNNDKRRGAMIGDVVGLGKTITACAVSKIFENATGASTLVICPANLQTMWKKYADKYNLKMEIHSIAKPIDVSRMRHFPLIIVDESHNLRNGATGKRYNQILNLIQSQNSSVLLLTATPYNKDYSDIANQLRLFLQDDRDLGIRPEEYIKELGDERDFLSKHPDIDIRSLAAFEKSTHAADWNDLMRLFLIRRTRTFIKNNYTETDPITGRKYLLFSNGNKQYFPDRIPKALKFDTTPGDQYSRLYSDEMLDKMLSLRLPRYGLTAYVNEAKVQSATDDDKKMLENLSRAGSRNMGFCKATFFKRIDSSGLAFLLTVSRHILRNMLFVYAIDNRLDLPIADENQVPDEYIEDQDMDANVLDDLSASYGETPKISDNLDDYLYRAKQYYEKLVEKGNVKFINSKYFKKTLKSQLLEDSKTLIEMIKLCGTWKPEDDKKLELLENLISNVHGNDKILIFTQYSDTAKYIGRELTRRKIKNIDVVTGNSENPTAQVEKFSPKSNDGPDIPVDEQTRVMIATDVLSEGHNLQDSHIIVNYDLPWAIIRLIQRAGRVDRIGQESDLIYCYSFFPAEGIENIISIRKRLNERINQNAELIGSDETFFEGNAQNLKNMYNEKAGVLDDAEENMDVDVPSMAYQIWKDATDANPKLKEIIPSLPDQVYSSKATDDDTETGVITYIKTPNDYDVLSFEAIDGTVRTTSQVQILKTMRCAADTPRSEDIPNHLEIVGNTVERVMEQSSNISSAGVLGNRLSTRVRLVHLIQKYLEQDHSGDIFAQKDMTDELKSTLDDIFSYPLLESAKRYLGQMLRRNSNEADIVQYVLELRRDGQLCNIPEENRLMDEPKILCSLGIVKTNG